MSFFKQYYLGCLSHASYLIGDGGEAVVVDPQRDVEQYLDDARAAGLTIRHVVETHLHADFVSGHLELASLTGARIHMGHRAGAEFDHVAVVDGDVLRVGALELAFLETPGHTPEGISVVVRERGVPTKVLTGDTLFIGDVGRPDLVGSKGYTAEAMAGMLYESLHGKLLTLPDDVEVYPAHGAGSSCGRFISDARSSTIGEQRRTNYALRPMTKDAFVRLATTDLPAPPAYFAHDAETNRRGPAPRADLPRPPALSPERVTGLVLDVRAPADFARGHVPGSVNIGLGGSFASWAGSVLDVGAPIVLVADRVEEVDEATTRLARVGIERVVGYLDGGVGRWPGRLAVLEQVTVEALHRRRDAFPILDVRSVAEYRAGHVATAVNVPLIELHAWLPALDREQPVYVICGSGYRSSIATTLLLRRGHRRVVNVVGGHAAWLAAGLPVVTPATGPSSAATTSPG